MQHYVYGKNCPFPLTASDAVYLVAEFKTRWS